jgi:serine/threonine-protein kinase
LTALFQVGAPAWPLSESLSPLPRGAAVPSCKPLFFLVALYVALLAGRAALSPAQAPTARGNADLPAQVKALFRARCFECHGGSRVNGGVKVLDHDRLLKKKKVVPGKPDDSPLYQAITATDEGVMPPTGQPRLSPDDIDLVRRWIVAGAAPFPADVPPPVEKAKDPAFKDVAGIDYVLKKILAHVRDLPRVDRPFVRYFSINHVLSAGATPDELDLQRQALAKAINHLSWEKRIVRPTPIDAPVSSVFAVDLRKLGWHSRPFQVWDGARALRRSRVNLWDLALLEYPYGVFYEDSDTFDHLLEEYVAPAGLIRPIPYVRADWFVSTITQPPLYEDVLGLPYTQAELEARLEVDVKKNVEDYEAKRAGMAVSGVSRNNRVVERHPSRYGAYWLSFDFRTSKGRENMFKDPIALNPTGGEFIFNLPNGLQGYFVADSKGVRLESAPTDIVTDKFAEDKTVRNGLACMRCHDKGMKEFTDTVRPALEKLPGSPGFDRRLALKLYVPQKEMEALVKEDQERFLTAMKRVLGKEQKREPLIPVSQRYLDHPLHLTAAAGELGLADPKGLSGLFRLPRFTALGLVPLAAQGVVRRDAWEDYYDQVVRGLGLGVPVVPIDGVLRHDFGGAGPAVELKTNKRGNVFEPGELLVVLVTNKSARPIHVELVGTSTRGRKVILTGYPTLVKPGQTYRYPEEGGITVRGGLGKEQITLLASHTELPRPVLLRGKGVADRVVHPFYAVDRRGKRPALRHDAAAVVKRTIEIETR